MCELREKWCEVGKSFDISWVQYNKWYDTNWISVKNNIALEYM